MLSDSVTENIVQLNPTLLFLLQQMSDGEFHSGQVLGEILGVSRAAVWKSLSHLGDLGIAIESVKGKGYRIVGGLSLIDEDKLRASLPGEWQSEIDVLEVLPQIPSTNTRVLELLKSGEYQRCCICTAESQTAGRGRRGRQWVSPFAQNIYLSLSWRFEQGVVATEGLSLAVGVAIVDALDKVGVQGAALKWPNDVLYDGRKLGGVLLEITGDMSGECHVVVGLGLNVAMSLSRSLTQDSAQGQASSQIDQPWVDIHEILNGSPPSRTALVSALLAELLPLLSSYERRGFSEYMDRWQAHAAFVGEQVSVSTGSKSTCGTMLGVASNGALQLMVDGECKEFVGGEVSLRVAK